MKRISLLFAVVLFVCFSLCPSSAVPAEKNEDLYQRANTLFAEKKYDEAYEAARQALVKGREKYGDVGVELCNELSLLAEIQNARKNYQEAAQYLEWLRVIQEANWGKKHRDVAVTVGALIKVYEKQGNSERANQLNTLADLRWGGGITARTTQGAATGKPRISEAECREYRARAAWLYSVRENASGNLVSDALRKSFDCAYQDLDDEVQAATGMRLDDPRLTGKANKKR